MKALVSACVVSALTLAVLIALCLDYFWKPVLALPAGMASSLALVIIAINVAILILAVTRRQYGRILAWVTISVAAIQVVAIMIIA